LVLYLTLPERFTTKYTLDHTAHAPMNAMKEEFMGVAALNERTPNAAVVTMGLISESIIVVVDSNHGALLASEVLHHCRANHVGYRLDSGYGVDEDDEHGQATDDAPPPYSRACSTSLCSSVCGRGAPTLLHR